MRFIRPAVVFTASLILGGTFILAGVLKSMDVDGFARDIALHGIIGEAPSAIGARLLIPFELVLGLAVVIGYRRRQSILILLGTLVMFIAATSWAWSQGNTEGCGCFGQYAARGPGAVIVEDLILMAAGTVALALSRRRPWAAAEIVSGPVSPRRDLTEEREIDRPARPAATAGPGTDRADSPRGRWKPILLAVVAMLSAAFALASPYLPIDDYATALRPGVRLSELGLDRIVGNLAEGDRLLVILVPKEEASGEAVERINALSETPGTPTISGLTSATEDERAEFFFAHAPAFELLEVPAADLRRLYRRAPRSFRVHNGVVLTVWQGIPTVEEFAR